MLEHILLIIGMAEILGALVMFAFPKKCSKYFVVKLKKEYMFKYLWIVGTVLFIMGLTTIFLYYFGVYRLLLYPHVAKIAITILIIGYANVLFWYNVFKKM